MERAAVREELTARGQPSAPFRLESKLDAVRDTRNASHQPFYAVGQRAECHLGTAAASQCGLAGRQRSDTQILGRNHVLSRPCMRVERL